MGWACFQSGRPSPSKDRHVQRTFHWPSWERGSKESIQGQPEEVTLYLQHRPQAVVWPCCSPCGLAPHNPSSCCPVPSGQKKFTQRQETEDQGPSRLHYNTRHYFSLQSLLAALSPASAWLATSVPAIDVNVDLLNLRSRSQAMMAILPGNTRRDTSELPCRLPTTHFGRQIRGLGPQNVSFFSSFTI